MTIDPETTGVEDPGLTELAPPVIGPEEHLETIALVEDRRTDGDGALQVLATKGLDAQVRERAATALGRLPFPGYGREVTLVLVKALDDPEPRVRAAAAFALGMRADPASADGILAHWKDSDPGVRARLVEAASRLAGTGGIRDEVLFALNDPDVQVRHTAAVAPHRWSSEDADAEVVDSALVHHLEKLLLLGPGPSPHSELAWRILFTLQRRDSPRARKTFVDWCGATDPRSRLFAAKGLARRLAQETGDGAEGSDDLETRTLEALDVLGALLTDSDWRVVVEALAGLAAVPVPTSVPKIERALDHPVHHVRLAAYQALGSFGAYADAVRGLLEHARVDKSASVRATALIAEAKVFGNGSAADLELKLLDRNHVVRAGVAQAAAELESVHAVPILLRLAGDENPRVAGAAVEGLGRHVDGPETTVRERLHAILHGPDNGLRLAAITALRESSHASDLPHLEFAFDTSRGDVAPEVAFNVLENAALIHGSDALPILTKGVTHDDVYVRLVAARLLEERGVPVDRDVTSALGAIDQREVPLPGKDYELNQRNPRVQISTNRGVMSFELFPREAPLHVYNFLQLAERDHYDNLTFHRVVGDFVIQGGDYRGDGNGSTTWRGDALPGEFTPRQYVRGSLGMPRNANPDSGGSQIFVTHRATPHLDGRYTIFGELRDGFDVLDEVEVGDVILDVRLVD